MPKMDVPGPIHGWLSELKAALEVERGRNVTYPEVWEHVRDVYEKITADAEVAGQ